MFVVDALKDGVFVYMDSKRVNGLIPLLAQGGARILTRSQRTGAWWAMIGGTALHALGALGGSIGMIFLTMPGSRDSVHYTNVIIVCSAAGITAKIGGMVFVIGFTLYILKRRAAPEREQQLEALTAAMAEELRVLRERAG